MARKNVYIILEAPFKLQKEEAKDKSLSGKPKKKLIYRQ